MEFKVKNIFITGANRGLGFALTKQMLQEFNPDHLIATYRNPESSQALLGLAKEHANLHLMQFDVTDYSKLPGIVKEVNSITNEVGINLLFNNSAIMKPCTSIREVDRRDMLSHFETNTIAPTMIAQAFLPLLEKAAALKKNETVGVQRAAIVNMTSLLGSIALDFQGEFSYRVSKAALNMVSKIFSTDLKDSGITTIALHPGWVKTDMGSQDAPLTIIESITHIMKTLRIVNENHNGKFINYNGDEIPW